MIDVDVRRATYGAGGVDGFLFPIQRDEIVEMRETLAAKLAEFARSEVGHPHRVGLALGVGFQAITREALMCFVADRLTAAIGSDFLVPDGARIMPAIRDGRAPPPPPFLAAFRRGQSEAGWKRLGRPLKSIVRQSDIPNVWPTKNWLEQRTISVARSQLIDHQASVGHERVGHVPTTWWFANAPRSGRFAATAGALVDGAMEDAASAAYKIVGERPNAVVLGHLQSVAREVVSAAQAWLNELGQLRLPKTLWTGSGGNIWVRLLRAATREQGGGVRGHDHASGGGHTATPHYTTNEFFECDEFVTFTEVQADSFRRFMVFPDLLLRPNSVPRFLSATNWTPKTVSPAAASRQKVRTIMHVGMPFSGERLVNTPLMFDIPMLDWYARLFAWLQEQGFRTIHKAYPSHEYRPELDGFRRLGVEIEERPFEEVLGRADLILFDHASTTTFGHALRSSMPIALVDFGILPFNTPALDALEARCPRVTGSFDKTGRAQVDWSELRRAIAIAPERLDRTYPTEYLGAEH